MQSKLRSNPERNDMTILIIILKAVWCLAEESSEGRHRWKLWRKHVISAVSYICNEKLEKRESLSLWKLSELAKIPLQLESWKYLMAENIASSKPRRRRRLNSGENLWLSRKYLAKAKKRYHYSTCLWRNDCGESLAALWPLKRSATG